jgi:hypothetical protein
MVRSWKPLQEYSHNGSPLSIWWEGVGWRVGVRDLEGRGGWVGGVGFWRGEQVWDGEGGDAIMCGRIWIRGLILRVLCGALPALGPISFRAAFVFFDVLQAPAFLASPLPSWELLFSEGMVGCLQGGLG